MKLSDLERDREARIKQNKERLAALQVGTIVDGLVSKQTAAKQRAAEEEEHRRAQIREELAAVGLRRKSERASAAKTRLRLAQQAQSNPDASRSDKAGSEQSGDSAASASASGSGMASGSHDGEDEEVEYDPLADLEHDGNDHESSEDESQQESDGEKDLGTFETQKKIRKRDKQSGVGQSALRRADKQTASHAQAETVGVSDEDEDEDEDDADLQQALAMSLMEANAAHAGPSSSTRGGEGACDEGGKVSRQQETRPSAKSLDAPAKPSSRNSRKSKGQGTAVIGTEQQGKGKGSGKRRKAFALEAGPQDIKKAYAMIAPRSKRITQELVAQVWEDVRGGKLDPASANNMMTYAADVTGSEHLDFAAFNSLVAHFS